MKMLQNNQLKLKFLKQLQLLQHLSFIIFFAGAQLAIQSVTRLMNPQDAQAIGRGAVIAAIISIAGKTVLALLQFHYGKIADSEMVKANALNMKNDIIMSLGILVGLFLSEQFKLPILDPIIALLVGLWVIKNAAKLFLQVNFELMDGNADNSLYQKLFSAVSSVPGVHNPHKARIRKMASLFDIDLDIEVDGLRCPRKGRAGRRGNQGSNPRSLRHSNPHRAARKRQPPEGRKIRPKA